MSPWEYILFKLILLAYFEQVNSFAILANKDCFAVLGPWCKVRKKAPESSFLQNVIPIYLSHLIF